MHVDTVSSATYYIYVIIKKSINFIGKIKGWPIILYLSKQLGNKEKCH